jgi:hypothetical protein
MRRVSLRVQSAKLVLALIAISCFWTIVLPRVGELAFVRQRIEMNRAAGINPTAVFYTDHPGMGNIERSIAARVDAPSGWFWKPSLGR